MIQCSSQDVTAFPDWVRYSLSCDIKGTELKAEGRRQKAEGRRQKRPIDKLFILLRTGFALHPATHGLRPTSFILFVVPHSLQKRCIEVSVLNLFEAYILRICRDSRVNLCLRSRLIVVVVV